MEARLLYEHELAGVDKEDLQTIDEIHNVFRAGDGQQELNYLRTTGRIADWDAAVAWTQRAGSCARGRNLARF